MSQGIEDVRLAEALARLETSFAALAVTRDKVASALTISMCDLTERLETIDSSLSTPRLPAQWPSHPRNLRDAV